MRVLVTGATGFVGARLCERLLEAQLEPFALVRASSNTEHLKALGIPIRVGSFDDPASLNAALEGSDAVVHCAGGGKVKHVNEFYRANTDSTEALLKACESSQIERFILISSLSAAGPARGGPRTEQDPETPISHYGKSKLQAEQCALQRVDRFSVVIIRPPAVYGPRDTRMLPLYRWANRGAVPLTGPSNTTSVVYVDDCVESILCALRSEPKSGSIYFVEDGTPYQQKDLAACIAAGLGRSAKVLPIPLAVIRAAAIGAETYGRLASKAVVLTRDKVADISQTSWLCSSARIREELGWSSKVQLAEGCAKTAEFYKSAGWL